MRRPASCRTLARLARCRTFAASRRAADAAGGHAATERAGSGAERVGSDAEQHARRPPQGPAALSRLSADSQRYIQRKQIAELARPLGSRLVGQDYRPHAAVTQPGSAHDTTIAMLLAAQTHLGHSASLWNPQTQPFIYGIREGIHIISLDETLSHLRRAAAVTREIARRNGVILFVGTRDGQQRIVIEAAHRASAYHIFQRWIPGTITNGTQVVGSGKIRLVREGSRSSGSSSSSSNSEQPADKEHADGSGQERREVADGRAGQWSASQPRPPPPPPYVKPDLVIVLNPLENKICLRECAAHRIPTIGIIDTDSNPLAVTYPIPANDDGLRAVALIAGVLSLAGRDGRRLAG